MSSSSEISLETLHPDVLLDILKFLERKELEKCQLSCQKIKNFVDKNLDLLPLRVIPSVSHVSGAVHTKNVIWSRQHFGDFFLPLIYRIQNLMGYANKLKENEEKGAIVLYMKGHFQATPAMISGLRSCLIENLIVNSGNDLIVYGSIAAKNKHPLQVRRIHIFDNTYELLLSTLMVFLNQSLLTSEIRWVLSYSTFQKLVSEPAILKVLNCKNLQMLSLALIYDVSTVNNSYVLTTEMIARMDMKKQLNFGITLELDMKNVEEDFCINYYKTFKECSDPSHLLGSIIIYSVESNHIQKINIFVKSNENLLTINIFQGGSSADFKRKDGWTFRIIFNSKRELRLNIFHEDLTL